MKQRKTRNAYEAFDKLMDRIGYDNAVAIMCATLTTAQFIHIVNADV